MYTRVLQHLIQQNEDDIPEVFIFMDDTAGGHLGMGCEQAFRQEFEHFRRVIIQGGTTGFLQPADTVWCNWQLKWLLRRAIRKYILNKGKLFTTLSDENRAIIGKILSDVKSEWNSSDKHRAGVRKAFRRTVGCLMVDGEPTRELKKKLALCTKHKLTPIYEQFGKNPEHEHECEYCSQRFDAEAKLRKHQKPGTNACWAFRKHLQPPQYSPSDIAVLEKTGFVEVLAKHGYTVSAEPGVPYGLMFRVEGPNPYFAVVTGEDQAYVMHNRDWLHQKLKAEFWQKGTPIKYLRPKKFPMDYRHTHAIDQLFQRLTYAEKRGRQIKVEIAGLQKRAKYREDKVNAGKSEPLWIKYTIDIAGYEGQIETLQEELTKLSDPIFDPEAVAEEEEEEHKDMQL